MFCNYYWWEFVKKLAVILGNKECFELNKLRNSNTLAHLWLAKYQSKIQKSNINKGLSQGNHLASLNGTCECLFLSQARIRSIFICTSMYVRDSEGLTNQAYPSCFCFRISRILM